MVSAAVYSTGFAAQRAIGLLTLPLYTRVLTPSDYGSVGLLAGIYSVAGVIFAAGLDTSIARTYFRLAPMPAERAVFLHSVWRFLIIFPIVASVALAVLVAPFLGDSAGSITAFDLTITLVAAAFNTAATVLPLAVLRLRQDLRGYLWMTAVTTVLTPTLSVLFVVVLHQGVTGWFMALLIANIATLVAAMAVVPWHWHERASWRPVRTALIFSLPLMPHFLSHVSLQLADRGVIAGIVGDAELGIYTVASNLAVVVMMLVMAFNQAFLPTYARAGAEPGHERELANVVVLQIAAVVTVTLAGALLGMSAVDILTAPDYHAAAALMPWLVLGYGFLGVYFIPMNGATIGAGRRKFAWVATAASAATNIGLLLLFVPEHGVYAAAVASAAGYLVLLVLLALWAHAKPNPVRYDWNRIAVVVATGVAAYVGSVLTAPDDAFAALVVRIGWISAFLVVVTPLLFRRQLATRITARRVR